MRIEIKEVGPDSLEQYGRIPMRHRVESVLRVGEIDGGLGGLTLTETPFDPPYVKDYDELNPEGVARWCRQFDVSNWLLLIAYDGHEAVGGAAVAFRSPEVSMLQSRNDLAVLWDIRVHTDYCRQGIGSGLLDRAAEWAREQGCKQLEIETQDNNVPACRFYAALGCRLGSIDRYGYANDPRLAHEAMLIWYLDL